MQLNISKKIFNEAYIANGNLYDYSHRFSVLYGGAGSGKSVYISQKLIIKALRFKRKVLICRRTGATLKDTVYEQYKSTLKQFKILQYCDVKDYEKRITLPNDSELVFKGLDEETKLLSLTGFTDIHIEECFEVPKPIFEQLNTRLRSPEPNLEIYISFNPISQNHYLYDFVMNPPENTFILKTNYKDNKFLPKEVVEAYEEQGRRNPKWARVYLDGEFGVDPQGLVYQNIICKNFDVSEILKRRNIDVRVGIDCGFIDPTAIIVAAFDHGTKECFVLKESYKTGLTLDEIYNELVDMGISTTRRPIYCDSAEPRLISFLQAKHVRVNPAKKGAGSIEMGISFLQNYSIYIPNTCPNAIKEFQSYSYYKDPKTGEYVDKRYDGADHLCDALRYSVCDLYTKKTIGIINKAGLGL